MHTNQDSITELARQVTEDFEANRIARPLLAYLYRTYNPAIPDIDTFLDQAAEVFPAGNCGLTAVYLRHMLQGGEIIPAWPESPGSQFGTYKGERHTFLFLPLGSLVLDITADQFDGGPSVHVGQLQEPWRVNPA